MLLSYGSPGGNLFMKHLQIDADTIASLLPMKRAIDLMRDAFLALSAKRAVCPIRLNLEVSHPLRLKCGRMIRLYKPWWFRSS